MTNHCRQALHILNNLIDNNRRTVFSGMNTIHWADWNSGRNNWSGQLTISGAATSAPEPSLLGLMGLGIFALGMRRRKAVAAR